jgi:hypothetical protein
MNVEEVYLSWDTPGPGVSHVADDPPNSAHRHPNKETRTKREYGRQSGRVVTVTTMEPFPPILVGSVKTSSLSSQMKNRSTYAHYKRFVSFTVVYESIF